MRKWIYAAVTTLAFSQTLYAHGEDQLGPHKSFIRMPGAYHVEVVPKKNSSRIMLLDMHFKNPTVQNSNIKVHIKSGKENYTLKCKPSTYYFLCPVNNNLLKTEGMLTVESERAMSKGVNVEYPLPLRLMNKS